MAPPGQKLPPLDKRRLVTFVFMVFGMFMAILDIQIVSASLSEIQAGLSASADEISWVQTSYLIAEVIMIPLSGILARVLSTRWLFVISATGFTFMSLVHESGLRACLEHRVADRLPLTPGIPGRGDDPDRLRHQLFAVPAGKAGRSVRDDRLGRDHGADPGTDAWRLPDPEPVVALAVPDQCGAGNAGHRAGLDLRQIRQGRPVAAERLRLSWIAVHGAVPRHTGIRSRGRAAQRLARRPRHRHGCRRLRGERDRVLRPGPDISQPDRGLARVQGPQFRDRLPVQLRDRHRAVWVGLSDAAVPGPDPGLEQSSDR